MKKRLSVLGAIMLLVFSLAGCGSNNAEEFQYDDNYMLANADRLITTFNSMTEADADVFRDMPDVQLTLTMVSAGLPMEGSDFLAMIEAWQAGIDECGPLVTLGDYEVIVKKGKASVVVEATFAEREADILFEFDEKMNVESLTVSGHYSTGEILQKAGLNTILGMGTVFVVLIFISFIIYLFKYIPVIQDKFAKKNKGDDKAAAPAAVAPVVPAVEEGSDDEELVAAIAAAIAAYEGTSTDDFVVRSIKRRKSNRW